MEAAWPSGQYVGLAIRRSSVRVSGALTTTLTFSQGRPEFKSSATLVNSGQLRFLTMIRSI